MSHSTAAALHTAAPHGAVEHGADARTTALPVPARTRPPDAAEEPDVGRIAEVTDIRSRSTRHGDAQRAARRTHRRVVVLTDGGVEGFLQVAVALRPVADRLRDVTADVHEGVRTSEILCTVAVTPEELDLLTERLERESSVITARTW